MSTRTAVRGALVGAALVAALAAPVATAEAAVPSTVPVAHKLGLPTEPQQAPVRQSAGNLAAVARADAAADNGEPPLSVGGRASVVWILGGVLVWAGVIVARGVRRPVSG